MSLIVGQTVPIAMQLFDGATGKYPRAVVRNNSGTTLATVDLAHLASGLYQYNSYVMTDVPYITVQYIVYSDSGHTTIDTNYGYVCEAFDRNDTLSLGDVETGFTVIKALRLILSAVAGKLSGAPGTTIVIRDINDTTNRITATVDSDGNRTAVTYNAT